jgi:hypothetical protein
LEHLQQLVAVVQLLTTINLITLQPMVVLVAVHLAVTVEQLVVLVTAEVVGVWEPQDKEIKVELVAVIGTHLVVVELHKLEHLLQEILRVEMVL